MGKLFERIITVSLNPALDVTLWITSMDFNEPNKATGEQIYAGGKAVNIARVLTSLGEGPLALGMVGEDNSQMFQRLLDGDRVAYDFVSCPGAIRENLTLVIPDKRVLKVNRAGFPVSRDAMDQVKRRLLEEVQCDGQVLLVFAGSLPPNITAEAYKAFILSLKWDNVKLAIDTSVFKAKDFAELRPFIIKPNLPEFRQICGSNLPTEQSILKSAQRMAEQVDHVLVSLGAKGLLYASRTQALRLASPPAAVRSTIGAGDTLLAAFIYCLQQGKSPADAAAYAVAAGTASVMLEGTGVIEGQMAEELLPRVQIRVLR